MGIFSPGGSSGTTVSNDDLTLGSWSVVRQTLPGTANTEDSIVLGASTKWFRIRAQGSAKLLVSESSGQSANGRTIMPGFIFESPAQLSLAGTLTIYIQSNKASTIVEVETWT